jgi:hypothetical protein
MNRYGLILSDIGLSPVLDWITRQVVRPLAAALYGDLGGGQIEEHHGFIVEYGRDGDRSLDFHVDDADVTLNLCLGEEFTGGGLFFEGLRCERHRQDRCRPEERFVHEHAPGTALLHAGSHRHGARPLASGRRVNLILWCRRTAELRRADSAGGCPGWCGAQGG